MTREECNEHLTSKRGLYSHFKYIADALNDTFHKVLGIKTNLVEHDKDCRSAHVNEARPLFEVRTSLIILNNVSWNDYTAHPSHELVQ